MSKSNETWVKNMCQKLEGICMDIDELVCKEPVSFVGNRMETVGANVKNFFSSFVDDFGLTQVADPELPSKSINFVETEIKENTVDSNTNNPKEAPLVPVELCHKPSSTDLHCSEQATSEISQHLIGESGILINATSENTTQVDINSSTNSQNLDDRFEEGFLYDESLHSDATEFEYADWGIENIIDLNLDTEKIIKREPLMNLEENKTLLNRPIELECDSNTSAADESSEPGSSITCNKDQEGNSKHIIGGGLSSETLYESLNSSFQNLNVEPNKIDCKPTETVDYFSVSSDVLSSCGSFTTLSCDSTNEAYVSCSGTDGSTVDFEDIKYDTVKNGVFFQGGKLSLFPTTSRSKSYKKMLQDAFMSRKRLTKEYKQLAIWYGDIDKELCQPTESSKPPAQYQPDSEWELL